MVRPALRRAAVEWARGSYRLTERRACRALGVGRSMVRYRSRRPAQGPLRSRLKEIAETRVSYGYKRLHVLLRREGWAINHKRVYRLYSEERLTLRRKKPKRRKSALAREVRDAVSQPDQRWAMDFVHDVLTGGRTIRVLTVVDVHTRECVALEPRFGFRGEDVAHILSKAAQGRKLPAVISVDNGTEFTSRALDHWAYWNQVKLDFSRPGKPTDNAHIEAFNGSFRRECLSQHWFVDLDDARRTLREWQEEYNNHRPHISLGHAAPARYRPGATFTLTSNLLR